MTILRNMRLFAFGAVALLSAWGCVRDEMPDWYDPSTSQGLVRVNYTIDGMSEGTRAIGAEGHERVINDVHILFYRADDGSYVTYEHANVTAGTDSFTFPIPAVLVPNVSYQTLLVGNAHDHVPSGYESFDAYLDRMAALDYTEMHQEMYAERNMDHASGEPGGLPMYGTFVDGDGHEVLFSFTDPSDGVVSFTGTAYFTRSVCRLDLQHMAANKLIIDAVKLCNYRKAGYYFHTDAPKGDIVSGLSDGTWVSVTDPYGGGTTQEVRAKVYAFPNIVPVVVQNDDQTTYLMIRGYYQDGVDNTPDNPRKKLTYYRFNMAENGRSQILRRNYRYVGIINAVSGPGADDEQGAQDAEAPMLDYVVDDAWSEDDSNTVTDNKGNYITISRAMVTFDGYADLIEAVKVNVSDPDKMTWSLAWDETLVGHQSSEFEYARVDNQQFSIRTLTDNATDFTRNARLLVTASGGTVDPAHPLTATVSVMQFTSKDEASTLMVDGQVGTITQRAPGAGGTLSFQVETGSLRSGWQVSDPDNYAASAGVTWTKQGANRALLEINVPTNITNKEREFTFRVDRVGSDGAIDSSVSAVTIKIVQPVSDYLLTVSPSAPVGTDGFVIEAFDPNLGNPNGISKQQEFRVQLADPENYTWTVTSSFAKNYDAFLTKTNPAAKTTAASWTAKGVSVALNTITDLPNGGSIWLNVFRTAPGDPTIRGTLTFTAVPNDPEVGETQSISIAVTLKTSCTIGDVLVPGGNQANYFLVADRNVGAETRVDSQGNFITAGNYLANGVPDELPVHITGKDFAEHHYTQWIGKFYPKTTVVTTTGNTSPDFIRNEFFRAEQPITNYDNEGRFSPWYKEEDALKWKVPVNAEMTAVMGYMVFSKWRPFMVSSYKDKQGNYVGCFFPLAQLSLNDNNPYEHYGASTSSGNTLYVSYVTTSSAGTVTTKSSAVIRCVRALTNSEVQEQQDGYLGEKWR